MTPEEKKALIDEKKKKNVESNLIRQKMLKDSGDQIKLARRKDVRTAFRTDVAETVQEKTFAEGFDHTDMLYKMAEQSRNDLRRKIEKIGEMNDW
jgi:hypothetical protein